MWKSLHTKHTLSHWIMQKTYSVIYLWELEFLNLVFTKYFSFFNFSSLALFGDLKVHETLIILDVSFAKSTKNLNKTLLWILEKNRNVFSLNENTSTFSQFIFAKKYFFVPPYCLHTVHTVIFKRPLPPPPHPLNSMQCLQ